MSMIPPGMALPPHVAAQLQQQGPSVNQQLTFTAVQLSIASFNVGETPNPPTTEELLDRAKAIIKMVKEADTQDDSTSVDYDPHMPGLVTPSDSPYR